MTLERLLTPISASEPCGPDLEYDADFLQLQQSAQPRPEQQYGSTLIPAQAPDWGDVARQAQALLARSKDLRVTALLAQAWTEQRGLAGYADALQLSASLLENHWPDLYPRLEEDGETDPFPRHNALARLFDSQGCLRALRAATLNAAAGLSLREIDQLLDGVAPERTDYPGGRERLRGELARGWVAQDPELHRVPATLDAINRIARCVQTALGEDWLPDTAATQRLLSRLHEASAGQGAPQPTAETAATEPASPAVAPAPVANASGTVDWRALELHGREDITLLLEKVCHYLDQHEPSHPAPILLRRAQRLLQMSFYEILRDIAPDSLAQVDVFIGKGAQ